MQERREGEIPQPQGKVRRREGPREGYGFVSGCPGPKWMGTTIEAETKPFDNASGRVLRTPRCTFIEEPKSKPLGSSSQPLTSILPPGLISASTGHKNSAKNTKALPRRVVGQHPPPKIKQQQRGGARQLSATRPADENSPPRPRGWPRGGTTPSRSTAPREPEESSRKNLGRPPRSPRAPSPAAPWA